MVNPQMKTQTFEGIDLFAGAGGVTTIMPKSALIVWGVIALDTIVRHEGLK